MISLIAAVGENWEIGRDGAMPWTLSEDLKRFKRLTLGKTMVMGRKTFESLPGVLPGRMHWIAARDPQFSKEHPRVRIIRDLSDRWEEMRDSEEEYMIIGGGQIYAQALPYADRLYLTLVHQSYADADTYFPEVDFSQWEITERSELLQNEEGLLYEFVDFRRRPQES